MLAEGEPRVELEVDLSVYVSEGPGNVTFP